MGDPVVVAHVLHNLKLAFVFWGAGLHILELEFLAVQDQESNPGSPFRLSHVLPMSYTCASAHNVTGLGFVAEQHRARIQIL